MSTVEAAARHHVLHELLRLVHVLLLVQPDAGAEEGDQRTRGTAAADPEDV